MLGFTCHLTGHLTLILLLNIDSFADNTLYRLKIIDKTRHKNTHSTKQILNYLVDSFREFCVESQLNTQMAFSLLWSKFVSAFLINCSIAFVCSSWWSLFQLIWHGDEKRLWYLVNGFVVTLVVSARLSRLVNLVLPMAFRSPCPFSKLCFIPFFKGGSLISFCDMLVPRELNSLLPFIIPWLLLQGEVNTGSHVTSNLAGAVIRLRSKLGLLV